MILSKETKYGLLAVGYIALHQEEGKTTAEAIAKDFNIPLGFLFKILNRLNKVEILFSKRGPHGGYVLAREPEKVSLLEIIKTMEGSTFDPFNFIEHDSNEPFIVRMKELCKKATAEKNKVLSEATFAKMVGRSKK